MYIQQITQQPNFNGKVIIKRGAAQNVKIINIMQMNSQFKQIADLVQNKPFDIFISRNKQCPNFIDIAANKTLEDAQKVKNYTVKVKDNAFVDSVVDAAKDAIDLYEKFIKG